jgi:hypothetical protein
MEFLYDFPNAADDDPSLQSHNFPYYLEPSENNTKKTENLRNFSEFSLTFTPAQVEDIPKLPLDHEAPTFGPTVGTLI